MIVENGVIAPGGRLALVLWNLRVNLGTEATSVIKHPPYRND